MTMTSRVRMNRRHRQTQRKEAGAIVRIVEALLSADKPAIRPFRRGFSYLFSCELTTPFSRIPCVKLFIVTQRYLPRSEVKVSCYLITIVTISYSGPSDLLLPLVGFVSYSR